MECGTALARVWERGPTRVKRFIARAPTRADLVQRIAASADGSPITTSCGASSGQLDGVRRTAAMYGLRAQFRAVRDMLGGGRHR